MKKVLVFVLFIALLTGCALNIDSSVANTPFGMRALNFEGIFFMLSFFGGFACLIAGFALTVCGFTGASDIIVETAGFTARLINASPGIVLMIIGAVIIIKNKYKVTVTKNKDTNASEEKTVSEGEDNGI